MANQLGDVAADLRLLDTADKEKNLYSVEAPFTVVCFWDPDCSHCRQEIPRLDSMYQAKWKAMGVAIYAVLMDSLRADHEAGWPKIAAIKNNWLNFIHQHHLTDWIHVYQTPQMKAADYTNKIPSPRQLYDVYQTPTLYLLDKNKKIIAKRLDQYQIDELIQYKLKNAKN
jgi:thiol-disulfide isomerase/thioredoxin